MILWLVLFLLIISVSFVLAIQSMRDYQETPQDTGVSYSLFLIRQPEGLSDVLNSIGQLTVGRGLVISIERLFKDSQAALTIFGPKQILDQFTQKLNLLELEDYTQALSSSDVSIWEMGVKDINHRSNFDGPNNIFNNISEIGDNQFFWQVIVRAKRERSLVFKTQIRAVIYCKDPAKRDTLTSTFQNLNFGELTKVPKPFSTEAMLNFFKSRTLNQDSSGPILNSMQAVRLLQV